jgi:predicted ATPase
MGDLGFQALREWRASEPALQIQLEPPEDLRSLRSQKGSSHNLPAPLNRFVGRERELAEVAKLLATSRLVTLTGAAGIGKTRLALQAALNLAGDYPDGVWLVELTPLSDPALVSGAATRALLLRDDPGCPPTESLISYLRHRQLLLIFDNCEHVIAAAAELAEVLLRSCPSLQVLATSREALGIAGEAPWVVPPMSVPPPGEETFPGPPGAGPEAIRLFCERVVTPHFVLTPAVAPAVGEICRRLDGIPLAIELAAARVGVLSPAQIAARLDDRFSLLTSGSRTALPRHRTLRAALEWSHDLLLLDERILLRRLSVFLGGFCLEAAEEVCANGEEERAQVLGALTRLVTKSLVVSDTSGSEARYRLLETIREYASEKLAESGEGPQLQEAHARWCLNLAAQAEPELTGSQQTRTCERLETEHPNLRSALEWSLAREPQWALRIASALTLFWSMRGHAVEGRAWLERAWSAGTDEAPPALRARARWGAGFLAFMLGDLDGVLLDGQEALLASARIGDTQGCARSLHVLGQAITHFRGSGPARPLLEESVMLARTVDDAWCLAGSLSALGVAELYEGRLAAARAPFEECVAVARRAGNPQRLAGGLLGLAFIALDEGRYEDAEVFLEEAWPVARELATSYLTALALVCLGKLASARGHFSRGRALMVEGVTLHHESGLRPFLPFCLNALGQALLWEDNPRRRPAPLPGGALALPGVRAQARRGPGPSRPGRDLRRPAGRRGRPADPGRSPGHRPLDRPHADHRTSPSRPREAGPLRRRLRGGVVPAPRGAEPPDGGRAEARGDRLARGPGRPGRRAGALPLCGALARGGSSRPRRPRTRPAPAGPAPPGRRRRPRKRGPLPGRIHYRLGGGSGPPPRGSRRLCPQGAGAPAAAERWLGEPHLGGVPGGEAGRRRPDESRDRRAALHHLAHGAGSRLQRSGQARLLLSQGDRPRGRPPRRIGPAGPRRNRRHWRAFLRILAASADVSPP